MLGSNFDNCSNLQAVVEHFEQRFCFINSPAVTLKRSNTFKYLNIQSFFIVHEFAACFTALKEFDACSINDCQTSSPTVIDRSMVVS